MHRRGTAMTPSVRSAPATCPTCLTRPTGQRVRVSVVMKFGGTSVADPDAINRLIGIVRSQQAKTTASAAPVVVVSALSSVTDALVAVAQLAEDGDADRRGGRAAGAARAARRASPRPSTSDEPRDALLADVRTRVRRAERPRARAAPCCAKCRRDRATRCIAVGELVSSRIVAAAFADDGIPSAWVDARTRAGHRRRAHGRGARHDRDLRARARTRRAADRRAARWPCSAASSARPPTASRRRSAAAGRTTRRRSSAPASASTRSRSGPTWTAC